MTCSTSTRRLEIGENVYVCLCNAVTNRTIVHLIDGGLRTSAEIAERCGAGAECGRCRRTVRAMIESYAERGNHEGRDEGADAR